MKKLATLSIRLITSVDCIIGMLVYITCSLIFHETWNVKIFTFSLVMAHFPDFDLVPYLLIRKYMRIPSHWLVGHHPIILIPLSFFIGIGFAGMIPVDESYIVTIALENTLLHLVHDSLQIQGLHWFSPFLWDRYTLHEGFPKKVSHRFWLMFALKAKQRTQKSDSTGEITGRITQGSYIQWIIWILSLSAVVGYAQCL